MPRSLLFVPAVWLRVKLMGGRGAWFATPVALGLMILGSLLYITCWKCGAGFQEKRLVLTEDFGTGTGEELLSMSGTVAFLQETIRL